MFFFFFMVGNCLEYMTREEIIAEIGNEEINEASIEEAIYKILSKRHYPDIDKRSGITDLIIFSGDISGNHVQVSIDINSRVFVGVNTL